MFWLTLYLLTAYAAVGILWLLLCWLWKRPSALRQGVLALLLAAPLFPYLAVGIQTATYGEYLRPYLDQAMRDSGMVGPDIDTMRIMSIDSRRAVVYVTEPCGMGARDQVGELVRLKRVGQGWKLDSWEAVWSECGSADGNTFPPFPEAKEF